MTRKRWIVVAAAGGVLAAGGIGGATAFAASGDGDRPITGAALDKAEAAALAHTGGGNVTETEAGDEESAYEVEVTLPDGRQVDVQLDETFAVVGSSADNDAGEGSGGDGADG